MNAMRKIASTVVAGLLMVSSAGFALLVTAVPANAMSCGYHTQMEEYDSGWSFSLPFVGGSYDPFGGERSVAYYGNCSDSMVKIRMQTKGGSEVKCVEPNTSARLGLAETDREISYASKIGYC